MGLSDKISHKFGKNKQIRLYMKNNTNSGNIPHLYICENGNLNNQTCFAVAEY
jgi:hypothetical protein